MVTVVGPGGVGKSRLALEAAHHAVVGSSRAAAVVELGPTIDGDPVAATLIAALGLRELPERSAVETLIQHLTSVDLALILDGCEHLIEPLVVLIHRLLAACHHLTIITTSRERLGMVGEQVMRLEPLPVDPEPGREGAVELFWDRAMAVGSAGPGTDEGRAAAIEICRRVDGIPLAIELAAARAATVPIAEIARMLARPTTALSRGIRSPDPRHRSLEPAIGWSYSLLSPDQQSMLRCLSVCEGSFAADDAAAIAGLNRGRAAELLEDLVEKSVVTIRPGDSSRYGLLETIRAFAGDRLITEGEESRGRSAHADHFQRLARAG